MYLYVAFVVSDSDIMTSVSWINSCIVGRDGKPLKKSATMAHYHRQLKQWCDSSDILPNRRHRSLLALGIFEELLEANKAKIILPTVEDEPLSEREHSILEYIAGYLLHKMKKKPLHSEVAMALSPEDQQAMPGSWTERINRGGLVIPCLAFTNFVVTMEAIFRSIPVGAGSGRVDFVASVLNASGDIQETNEINQNFIEDVADIFYLVRVNQKCRSIIDKHSKATSSTRKAKPLRDTL